MLASCQRRLMAAKGSAFDALMTGAKRKRDTGERDMVTQAASKAKDGQPGTTDLGKGASVLYVPRAFKAAEAEALCSRLEREIPWEHKEIRVVGRMVFQPRLIAYMADDSSLAYTYSGVQLLPLPWNPAVAEVKGRLEELCGGGQRFNSCLLNLYRNGNDNMGWHSDNEPLYGPSPLTIGSVSFGACRDFMLRWNDERDRKLRFPLGEGAVLVMQGTCQDHTQHSVPVRAGVRSARINLTFRTIVSSEAPRQQR